MNNDFVLDKIETRSSIDKTGARRYIVRGYTSVPNKPYVYQYETGKDGKVSKSLKELMTPNAQKSMDRQLRAKKVFADIEHQMAGSFNIDKALRDLESEQGVSLGEKRSEILSYFKNFDIPLMKVTDFRLDDTGLFLETDFNPHFRGVDEVHKSYFDAVWGMAKDGFLDRFSVNMNPTKFVEEDGVTLIDDVELYGVSLTGGGANDWLPPVEVAMRSIMEVKKGGGIGWQKKEKVRRKMML